MTTIAYKKYILVFFITLGVFALAFLLSNFLYQQKIREVDTLEDKIALSLLSSEVQSALLSEFSCEATSTPFLARELNELSAQLTFMESERGINNPAVIALKKRYSLLEIKDYLFGKDLAKRCGTKQSFVLYFYSNTGDCKDCQNMGYALTALQNEHPDLKVYSFDYNLEISGVRSLIEIYDIKNTLPALLIDKTPHYGFTGKEDVEKFIGLKPKKKPAQ